MDDPATACGAIFEATAFLSHFNDLPDPRQAVKVVYPLDEVLLLSLLAVLAGAETLYRHCSIRKQETGASASVPPIPRWDAAA